MTKLEKLSPEQEALMFQTRDEWIDNFFSLKRINEPEFEKGISWLYNDLLKKPSPKIVYCESWIGALLAIGILKNRDSVGDSVWASVRDSVRASVWASVGDSVGASVGASVGDYSNETNSYANFGYCAFYEYFERIGILDNKQFASYKKLIKAGAFQVYEYENYVFAIQPPIAIKRNTTGQLNSIEGKAFEWADNYGFYYINGVEITEEYFNMVKDGSITTEVFFKEQNEEKKSAIIGMMQQLYGDEYVFRFFSSSLKEVNSFVDKKDEKYLIGTMGMNVGVYTLFKGVINNVSVAYVRCYCPSTDRMFFLGVHPDNNTAKDAIASLYQVPVKLKKHIKSINRQGERFSTVFDEDGTELLKNGSLSKEDIADTTTISGEQYFKLMQYEF